MKHVRVEELERRRMLSAALGSQPSGALTGRIIFTSGGHGYTARNTTDGAWETGRPLTNGMVEDFGNFDQQSALAHSLFNAGATVVPMRPIDHQTNEVVIDNGSATFTGTWNAGVSTPYFSKNNGNDATRYVSSTGSATETATARYTPNIPQAGFYPVYGWALNGPNRLPDQTYRITYAGGVTEVKVNHQKVGRGWIYLGTYYFNAGTGGYVEISNKTSAASPSSVAAIADAIRFGNGMGDIDRGGGISGKSREDEQSLYWIQAQAGFTAPNIPVDPATYRGGNTLDQDANVSAPPRWAAWMNDQTIGTMTDRLFLSYHSNAGSGSSRGTLGLYNGNNDPATKTPHQQEWAQLIGREVTDDLVAMGSKVEFAWANNANVVLDRSDIEFGEINNLRINNEFDATICEVAFHDNAQDAADMLDPDVRRWVARASEHAMVKYFNTYGGGALNFLPDAPINVKAIADASGNVTISWQAPVADGAGAGAPSGYMVYQSTNGYGFDGGTAVGNVLSYMIPSASLGSDAYYFKVVAINAGGQSPDSAVVGARKNPTGASPILVVNGFDRMDRASDDRASYTGIVGSGGAVTVNRVRTRYNNTFDYVVQAGEAIEFATSGGFSSCENDQVRNGTINLASYQAVIWLSGEQSTAEDTFNPTEQTAITNYVNGGGRLFVSGSEIGWDLVAQGGGSSFYSNTLHAAYVSDDAGVYAATGIGGTIFSGISLNFDNGASGTYDVDFPDVINTSAGSIKSMNYSGGSSGAAIQWASGSNSAKVVMLAFPFETITTSSNRNAVMQAVLNYFSLDLTAPSVTNAVFNYLTSHNVVYSFSENVSASISTGDLAVTNTTTSAVVPTGSMSLSYNGGNNNATLTFPGFAGGILPDGNYHAVINGAGVTDAVGNRVAGSPAFDFFVLAGDANHDRSIDTLDFNSLAANFGASPRNFSQGDFNYSGGVDTLDFNILASKFGGFLAPAGSARVASSVAARAPGAATTPSSVFSSSSIAADEDRTDSVLL